MHRYDVAFVALALTVTLSLLWLIFTVSGGATGGVRATDFRDTVNEAAELALLRPIVVSVFERAGFPLRNDDDDDGDGPGNLSDTDTYNERLVVVRPNNWLIYTNNGITFHYLTNNVSQGRINCSHSGSLSAVEYRLTMRSELLSGEQAARSLRFSCINYTFDQLTRVFTQSSNRTDIDLTAYFDKRASALAPDFTVHAVLQFLVTNAYV